MVFTTLRREKCYQAHIFDVAKVHVRLPDGRERSYDLVEHGDSVTLVPVDSQGNIYFVLQHRVGAEGELLELPAGVLNPGEDPLESAKRELREEIGKDTKDIKKLGGFYLAPGYTDEYMTIFLAKQLFDSPLAPDEDEFLNVIKMPVEEAYQQALSGKIRDGKSVAALFLAQPFLKQSGFR